MTITAERAPAGGAGLPPVPEQGQVVNVRGSNWAVADVRQQGLPRSPADEGTAGLRHVVDPQSLEEDRPCEGVSVFWGLVVGETGGPCQGPPGVVRAGRLDEPSTLGAFDL